METVEVAYTPRRQGKATFSAIIANMLAQGRRIAIVRAKGTIIAHQENSKVCSIKFCSATETHNADTFEITE